MRKSIPKSPQEKVGRIIIPASAHPWPHELRVARILANAGHIIEFLPKGNIKTPDILMDGIEYEIKSPEVFNANTLEHTIRDALKQAPNIIISTLRTKNARDAQIYKFLTTERRKDKRIKHLILITKQSEIVAVAKTASPTRQKG